MIVVPAVRGGAGGVDLLKGRSEGRIRKGGLLSTDATDVEAVEAEPS